MATQAEINEMLRRAKSDRLRSSTINVNGAGQAEMPGTGSRAPQRLLSGPGPSPTPDFTVNSEGTARGANRGALQPYNTSPRFTRDVGGSSIAPPSPAPAPKAAAAAAKKVAESSIPTLRSLAPKLLPAARSFAGVAGPAIGAVAAAEDVRQGRYTSAVDNATLGASSMIAPFAGPAVTYALQKGRDAALAPILRATGAMPPEYNPNVITPAMQKALQEEEAQRNMKSAGTPPTMLDTNTRVAQQVQPGPTTTAVTLGSDGPYGTSPMRVPTVASPQQPAELGGAAPGRAIDPRLALREGEGAFVNSRGEGTAIKTAPEAATGPNLNAYAPHQGGTGPASARSGQRDADRGLFGFMVDAATARANVQDQNNATALGLRTRTQDIALEKVRQEGVDKALDRQVTREANAARTGQWNFEQKVKRGERAGTGLDSFADSVADVGKDGKPLPQARDEFRGMVNLSLSRQGKELADASPADVQTMQQGYTVKRIIDSNRSYFGDQKTSRDLNDYAPTATRQTLTGKEYLFPSGQWVDADKLYGDKMRLFKPDDPRRVDLVRYLDESVAQAQAKQQKKQATK